MPVKDQPQTAFDDKAVQDAELETSLEKRESMKEGVTEYRRLDKEARARINEKSYGDDGDIRIGRFIICKRPVPARSVEFETAAATRIVIKNAEID